MHSAAGARRAPALQQRARGPGVCASAGRQTPRVAAAAAITDERQRLERLVLGSSALLRHQAPLAGTALPQLQQPAGTPPVAPGPAAAAEQPAEQPEEQPAGSAPAAGPAGCPIVPGQLTTGLVDCDAPAARKQQLERALLASIDDAGPPVTAVAAGAAGLWQRLQAHIKLSTRTKGLIMLNVLVLLVSTNWVVVKEAGMEIDPFGFAFLRFFVAAVAFSPFLKTATKDWRVLVGGAELGLYTAAGYMLQSMGLLTTDASRASFLSTFTVLVVPFLVGLTPGRTVKPITWAAAVAALVFRTEVWARRLGSAASLPLMSVVLATTMVLSGLACVANNPAAVASVLEHPVATEHLLTGGGLPWLSVLYTGLVTTDLALLMELFALHDVPSTDAAIIYSLEPLLGASFAYVLLGERWGAAGWAGAFLIVASSLVTQLAGKGDDAPLAVDAVKEE
eukprot:scaffold13.g383.t1